MVKHDETYLQLILRKILSALRQRWDLQLKYMALKDQIAVLERSVKRPQFTNTDRLFWVTMSTLWARWPKALEIVQADTVKGWRRHGFGHYLLGKMRCYDRDLMTQFPFYSYKLL